MSLLGAFEMERGVGAGFARGDIQRLELAEQRLRWIGRASPEVPLRIGMLELRRGLLADAERDFDRSLALHPTPAAWLAKGYVAAKNGNFARALERYDQALALDPRHVEALYQSAYALLELGRRADAVGRLTRAAAVDPANAKVTELLASIAAPDPPRDAARLGATMANEIPALSWTRRAVLRGGALLVGAVALAPRRLFAAEPSFALPKATADALAKSPLVYVSPLLASGKQSSCHKEVWYFWDKDAVVIGTATDRWKTKAVKSGKDKARIWVGAYGAERAELHREGDDRLRSRDLRAAAGRLRDPLPRRVGEQVEGALRIELQGRLAQRHPLYTDQRIAPPEGQRLGDVRGGRALGAVEVGQRAREPQAAHEAAHRQAQRADRALEQRAAGRVEPAGRGERGVRQLGVRAERARPRSGAPGARARRDTRARTRALGSAAAPARSISRHGTGATGTCRSMRSSSGPESFAR